MDIVRFEPSANEGAGRALSVSSLSIFFDAADAKSAKQFCRKKSALLHPANYEVDDGDLLELARAGGAIVFSFSDVLPERGFRRSILISKMRLLLSACRKRGTGFIFATLAKDASQVRSARELSAFAAVLGATDVERKAAEKRMMGIAGGSAKPKKSLQADSARVEK
jgi:RNase P/RNase MRP subunit p30